MNKIVRIALDRPLTFIVMALMILIAGVLSASRMAVDIFPPIRVPVLGIAWSYSGLPADEMAGRIISNYERTLTTTVGDIEHIESQSLPGSGIVKVYFQPGADLRQATASVAAISQAALRQMPPGTTAPLVINYDASTVPILQLALSGAGLSEQQLTDMSQNQIRTQLVTAPGAAIPQAQGGRTRQVQVDLDPQALAATGLGAQDITAAIAAQNQINPAGNAKIGGYQYAVKLNNAPSSIEALNDIPVKVVGGATIYMRDVAHVRDGGAPVSNIVHVNGQRSVLMTVLKSGSASTLRVISGVRTLLPSVLSGLPDALKVVQFGDQSVFVKAALTGVVREGIIAAALTSLMILLFLGSWRSTVIIALSIPLAILAAIAALAAFGQSFNVMTLGGLALAVGILVDDATVTIENINYHLEQGKQVVPAILDGAAQIVVPAFVSLLCICIVFVPMFFLPGIAGYLFVPMALAVVFAMIASFILSRTLVPTLAMYLLKPHAADAHETPPTNALARFQRGFATRFENFRQDYGRLLERAMAARKPFVIGFLAVILLSFLLVPFLGRNFFPDVDAGQIAIHVRAPSGSRVEQTAAQVGRIEARIRELVPPSELNSLIDAIGLPQSPLNQVYQNTGTIGPQDADVQVELKPGHRPTAEVVDMLRRELRASFPGTTFAFLPADITSQILNFGAPAPIDVQVSGRALAKNREYLDKLMRKMRLIPGLADMRLQQTARAPQLSIDVDRTRIGQMGLTERDVTNSLAGALAGSGQTSPVFFLNPENGVSYGVVAQTPDYRVGTLSDLRTIPVSGTSGAGSQTLGGLATIKTTSTVPVVSHYNILPVLDVYAAPAGRDLGAVSGDVQKAIDSLKKELPKGSKIVMRGQYQTMQTAFSGLGFGLLGAIVMIYLLIVVNFQSWLDPFVIITALPAALAGIVWMLFVTGTTLSVPALTGAIMCMGVATANSVLVVSFARDRLNALGDPVKAAMEASMVRFRPVLMTALAMIIGMLPMALSLGEGGEQNAPLGRAVIGGLVFATAATLLFVPVVFAIVHGRRKPAPASSKLVPALA